MKLLSYLFVFAALLLATKSFSQNDIILANDTWKYYTGDSAISGWNEADFDDSNWQEGAGSLGYGNGDEGTMLTFGDNAANKFITAYFRKTVTVSTPFLFANLELQAQYDDGIVIHINGETVYTRNLPNGEIAHNTLALEPIEGGDELVYHTINLATSVFSSGDNVIAVEVHKTSPTETDLRFDLSAQLQYVQFPAKTTPQANVTCDYATDNTIGCFTSVQPSDQTPGIIIPKTHTFQMLIQQGESPYVNSTRNVPGNPDFTGFIPLDGSSTQGNIALNHETGPGDVSLVSVHFDSEEKLWVRDSVRLVDFTQLVQTERNCSGGVTPWGTSVTSEESTTAGDANGDGYTDRGWQVEIDPISGKIMDYDGDGNPDKIWAMGRMNHENFVVNNAGTIAYQAEDGGTSCVYKYVLDTPNDLSAGTLYALQRTGISADGVWVLVPNATQADRNNTSALAEAAGGTDWNNPEDVEIGPDGMIYFTSKGDGTIWRFKDDGTTTSAIEEWVSNTNYSITHENGEVNESFGTGIDNLAFDNEGNCWALQDGGRNHLWVIRPDHTPAAPNVDLFAIIPAGAEPTGLTFSPDGKFGFISIQHPDGTNDTQLIDAAGDTVLFNTGSTIVFARKSELGALAKQPSFNFSGDTITSCESSLMIGVESQQDIQYVWSTGETTDSIHVEVSGHYVLTAHANNGKSFSDSIYVFFEQVVVDLPTDTIFCVDGELVAGDANHTYLWNNGATTETIVADQSGDYIVEKVSENGCSASHTISVEVVEQLVVNLGADTAICETCLLTLDAGNEFDSYSWSTGDTTQSILVDTAGVYIVQVINGQVCSSTDTILVEEFTGISDLLVTESVKLFPNPTNGQVTLNAVLLKPAELNIKLVNANGQEIGNLYQDQREGSVELSFNLNDWVVASGNYFLVLSLDGKEVKPIQVQYIAK